MDLGYSGSFLDYRTFSVFNRWDQRAQFELRRQETRPRQAGAAGRP